MPWAARHADVPQVNRAEDVNRRAFISSTAAAGLIDVLGGRAKATAASRAKTARPLSESRPNILLIMADQLRYPSVFPAPIADVPTFLSRFMPNVHRLWQNGVKFAGHYTAATPCSPARAALVTGLYSHQTWLLQNIAELPFSISSTQPWLNPGFPTYGKLLRRAGYRTPYIGKWHLAITPKTPPRLEQYGFDGLTYYDPEGFNLQGTVGHPAGGVLSDRDISDSAVAWLSSAQARLTPWCLTVSLINPHDIEYYWGGTEFRTYNELFRQQSQYEPFELYPDKGGTWNTDPLRDPPDFGYATLPPNWESVADIAANKPSTQAYFRLRAQLTRGGISDDPSHTGFTIIPYAGTQYGVAKAPFRYWRRGLDCYTLLMSIVDQRIGEVLGAIPADQVANTIIVFTSDHGDYAGAHGFVTGKTNTVYDEAYHIPLIVMDPTGRFVGDIDTPRTGLTSSVDMVRMLVSLGYNGSSQWATGDLAAIYGKRHDLIAMLQSANAAGRRHMLLTSDDVTPAKNNLEKLHLIGLRTPEFKLGTYARWTSGTTTIHPASLETEFYDYGTAEGRAEMDNQPANPLAAPALVSLLDDLVPGELEAQLPGAHAATQVTARQAYLRQPEMGTGR